jgi:hypothetical protein
VESVLQDKSVTGGRLAFCQGRLRTGIQLVHRDSEIEIPIGDETVAAAATGHESGESTSGHNGANILSDSCQPPERNAEGLQNHCRTLTIMPLFTGTAATDRNHD